MKSALQPSSSAGLVFSTAAALLAFASSAFADGAGTRHTEMVLESMLASPEQKIESPLPARMSLWAEAENENELKEAQFIALSDFLPQGRQAAQKPPFIDFSHFEMGGYLGMVDFSAAFKAKPSFVAGITARVPVPGLPGDWGIWGEAFLSYVSRDLPFYYPDKGKNWIGLAVGGDYTFVKDEIWYLRAQLGVLYAYWTGVNRLDNGMGVLAGVQVGFYWIKHNNSAVVTLTPQLSYDGSSWIGFLTVGFSVDF